MDITIGKIIKREFDKSGMTKAAFASKVGVSRNNVYYLFKRNNINTQLLKSIGKALNYDFFKHYLPDILDNNNHVAEDAVSYSIKKKAKLSLLIEISPDDDILSNEEFKRRLNDLMDIVS